MNFNNTFNVSDQQQLIGPPTLESLQLTKAFTTVIGLSIALNFPIFVSIVSNRELRHRIEMIPLAAVSGWETFYGVVYMWLGIKTIALAAQGPVREGMSAFECLVQFYNLGLAVSTPAVYWSLTSLAADRVLCLFCGTFYTVRGTSHKLAYIVIPAGFGIANLLLCIIGTIPQPPAKCIHPSACTLGLAPQKQYVDAKDEFILAPACLVGAALYLLAMIALRVQKKSVYPAIMMAEKRRQNAITSFFSLLALVTFCTLFLPRIAALVTSNLAPTWFRQTGNFYFNVLTTSHSLLYGLLFWSRKSDVRARALLVFQKMHKAVNNAVTMVQPISLQVIAPK